MRFCFLNLHIRVKEIFRFYDLKSLRGTVVKSLALVNQGSQVGSRAPPKTTTKNNLPVEPSGAPGTTNPQKKKTPIVLVSPS